QPASGFAFDFVDETTPLASVKRISPAYDNDVDIGTSAKRFKNIEAVSINGTPAPSGDGFLPRDGSLAMTGDLDLDGKEAKGVSALRTVNGVVVGSLASVGGSASVAVGASADASGLGAIAIGNHQHRQQQPGGGPVEQQQRRGGRGLGAQRHQQRHER